VHEVASVVLLHDVVRPDAGDVVDVAGLGHADHRVYENRRARRCVRPLNQLKVGAVHRIPGLKPNHFIPVALLENFFQFRRRVTQVHEVMALRETNLRNASTHVAIFHVVQQIAHPGVIIVDFPVHELGLFLLVWLIERLDLQDRERIPELVTQQHRLPYFVRKIRTHVERDRHRKDRTVREAHLFHHALVVRLRHEALQRVEAAVHQQFEVADLALCEIPRRQRRGLVLELLGTLPGNVEFRDRGEVLFHESCPGREGGEAGGRAGQFGVKRVVFGELAGEKLGDEAVLFRAAPGRERVGVAVPPVGAVTAEDPDEAAVRCAAQKGIEPPEGDPDGRGHDPLRGIGVKVDLAQQAANNAEQLLIDKQTELSERIEENGSNEGLEEQLRMAREEKEEFESRIDEIEAKLAELAADAIDAEVEAAKKALNQAREELSSQQKTFIGLEAVLGSLDLHGLHERLEQAESEVEEAEQEVRRWEVRAEAAKLLFETLDACRTEVEKEYFAPLRDEAENLLSTFFRSRDVSIQFGSDFDIVKLTRKSAGGFSPDQLSFGAREQLSLILRLAMARLLARSEPQPVYLDEALTDTDDDRFEAMATLLQQVGRDVQIIVNTCHKNRFRRIGADNLVDLEELKSAVAT